MWRIYIYYNILNIFLLTVFIKIKEIASKEAFVDLSLSKDKILESVFLKQINSL